MSQLLLLVAAHALLTVQRTAQPGLNPLPVHDHEDVPQSGQSQEHKKRRACGSRREEDVLVSRHHDVAADSDDRIDQLAKDAVSHLPAHHAPERPQGNQAAGYGVDQIKAHRFCLPRTSDG